MEQAEVKAEEPCTVVGDKLDVAAFRARFPALKNDTIFFDNAATTQKPLEVITLMDDFYRKQCANAGRASYRMSTTLAKRIEESRARVAAFIGAAAEDICFTAGATESLNLVALSWGLSNLKSGDQVMVCMDDHRSAVYPWINLKRILSGLGRDIEVVPFKLHPEGDYDLKDIAALKSDRTRLIAVSHVHHLYGLDMEVAAIRKIVGADVLISLDASQSVGHRPVNVGTLDVDFLSFSGHKMFAGNGAGVLYVRPSLRAKLEPVLVGGGMAALDGGALKRGATLAALLEAGTQNIPAILSMVPAIEFIEGLGLKAIEDRLVLLTKKLYAKLKDLPGIEFSPGVDRCGCHRGFGIISFRFIEGIATSDLAFLFDSENILVRTGELCLANRPAGDDYVRVSMHIYNTDAEINRFVAVLKEQLGD